jgi:Hydrazine synthase alpha subunit middle domain
MGWTLKGWLIAGGMLIALALHLSQKSIQTLSPSAQAVPYDIVYVRAPRYGDTVATKWPEVFNPINVEPGSDLMLLHPDGSEEVLFPAGGGAVADPVVSFDAKTIFFSYFPDVRTPALNYQRSFTPMGGADIYKINLATRAVTRLTQQTWEPPAGAAKWSTDHLTASAPDAFTIGYGVFNLGPCPLPGGKLMFVSSRDGYLPNKNFTFPNLRLYVMDEDGTNVEPIGHINMGSALHPHVLTDGRVMFSSYEGQGARDERLWSLWSIWPDGTRWEPLMSAFNRDRALHFQTQLSDGRVSVIEYYNLNNAGFGTLLAFDASKRLGEAAFGSPNPNDATNPAVKRGLWWFQDGHPAHKQVRTEQYRFSPKTLLNLTAFTHSADEAASNALDGSHAGKVTHPAAAPNNDVLLVWSPGPANLLNRPINIPRLDGGIYVLKGGNPANAHSDLVKIKNDPNYNEQQPKPVVPYAAIYGIAEPATFPKHENDGTLHTALPPSTPFGLVGSSSFYHRDTAPHNGEAPDGYNGLEKFNTRANDENPNWFTQGADAGKYNNSDIFAVRIVAMESVADKGYGPIYPTATAFIAHTGRERLRILGEIPLRKFNADGSPVLDPQGNPDTSFLAKIPGDTPFTFQTLDKDGMVLNMAQTWHMVRPGEVRTNCGGCHAHSKVPLDFSKTAAGKPGYVPTDLTRVAMTLAKNASGQTITRTLTTPVMDVEYRADIEPIFQRACVQCHSKTGRQEAGLVLDDDALTDGMDGTFLRLTRDPYAQYGIKPVIGTWRQENSSRYVRKFQSRRSLLAWKVFGRRLDGWTNADHPTEAVLGDASTLPAGADSNAADIDFTGTIMPPTGSGVAPLTDHEKMLIARWIDLGAPSDNADPQYARYGWFSDELKPTLYAPTPTVGVRSDGRASMHIRIGAHDHVSGIDWARTSVKANFTIAGRTAGTELADLFGITSEGVRELAGDLPTLPTTRGELTVRVADRQGNITERKRTFSFLRGR